jgi:hypothetical protein
MHKRECLATYPPDPLPLIRGRGIKRDGVAIKPKGDEVNKNP